VVEGTESNIGCHGGVGMQDAAIKEALVLKLWDAPNRECICRDVAL
jgi:hypothetical protein